MPYEIKNPVFLRKVLWTDFALGASNALAGLIFAESLEPILGLSVELIWGISVVTLLYALVALRLAAVTDPPISLFRGLIYANAAWAIFSVGLTIYHFAHATLLGQIFLLLQIIVVGGLSYVEARQLVRENAGA